MNPREKLLAARMKMCDLAPYFRSVLWSLMPKEMPGLGTFGVTTGGWLLYDPEKAKEWTIDQIAAVLMHEVGHVLRDHARRCRAIGADPHLWNLAGDAEINDDLDQHWLLPGGCVLPEQFGCERGLTAEVYYLRLREMQQECSVCASGGDGDDKENQQQGGQGQGSGKSKGKGKGDGGHKHIPKGWQCGSGAGNPFDCEPDNDPAQAGDARSEGDMDRVRAQAAREIQVAAASSQRGTIPEGWVRWAEEQLRPPRVPWRQKLARHTRRLVASRSGMSDYTYTRPSRRQPGFGVGPGCPVLPAMHGHKPRVAVALDTSGSMGDKELTEALAETAGVLAAVGSDVTFIACDAAVHSVAQVKSWREMKGLVKGGGGTDFVPVFEALEKLPGGQPDVLVFITDGCGPAPAEPPRMGVIWLLVGPYRQRPMSGKGDGACPWGEVIELVPDGEDPQLDKDNA